MKTIEARLQNLIFHSGIPLEITERDLIKRLQCRTAQSATEQHAHLAQLAKLNSFFYKPSIHERQQRRR